MIVTVRLDGLNLNCNAGCKRKRKADFSIFTPNGAEDVPPPAKSSRLEFTPCAKHLPSILQKIRSRRT